MAKLRADGLLPRQEFVRRLSRSVAVGFLLIAISLGVGMSGYHWLAGMSWIDAFLDAAMILSGMGPVSPLETTQAKIFAGCYAIYCGIALVSTAGIMLAPVIHRYLHKFYLENYSDD